ncbi:hypothetical protein [Thermoplasma volcanium]|nr:hypothetical protein [Thermoplasma volcanium]
MNGSVYEREIRDILSGRAQAVEKYAQRVGENGSTVRSLITSPFFVTRAAGSLGADIIAIRHDISMVIEVKSSIRSYLAFSEASGKKQDQAERLSEMVNRAGIFLVYAFRLKNASGDPWRLFTVPGNPTGRMKTLYELIPTLYKTKDGNYVMKWDNGLPFTEFIAIINGRS